MKITFEGGNLRDIYEQMHDVLATISRAEGMVLKLVVAAAPEPEPEAAKVKQKVKKPDVAERMAKVRAARKPKPAAEPVHKPVQEPVQEPVEPAAQRIFPDEDPFEVAPPAPVLDMAQMMALKLKTTEDLQAAYAGGKHEQVLQLLKTYGNGAKSFRELTVQDFLPIRAAIDQGALA